MPRAPVRSADEDQLGWRRNPQQRVGFNADEATAIAADCAFDLHELIELVERGCPPALATRILAPVDQERNPC